MSDGYAVFMDTKKHYNESIFQRLYPKSTESSEFLMDELDINAMIECVENESKMDPKYFLGILTSAFVIASRIVKREKFEDFFKLGEFLINWSMLKQNPETGLHIAKSMSKLCKLVINY